MSRLRSVGIGRHASSAGATLMLLVLACTSLPPTPAPVTPPAPVTTTAPSVTATATTTTRPTTRPTATAGAVPTPATPGEPVPDLVLVGGPVITVDGEFSIAGGIAVRGGRIAALGSAEEIGTLTGPTTTVIELDGRTVMPGIVDPHIHELQFAAPSGIEDLNETQERLFSHGRTTVGNPTIYPDVLAALEEWSAAGHVMLRHHLYLGFNTNCGDQSEHWYMDRSFTRDAASRQAVAGIKVFLDGGSCNSPAVSWQWQNPRWEGMGHLYLDAGEVADVARVADDLGAQLVVHVGGDRALEAALDGLEEALAGGPNSNRHRIDHNMFVRPDQLSRYSEIGVAPIVFGSDQACLRPLESREEAWLEPEQIEWLAPHRAMLDANPELPVGWHSDAPLLTLNFTHDLFGLTELGDGFILEDGTVCRVSPELRSHAVTMREAITMMTIGSAYAMQLEAEVGSLEVGKHGDLIVLVNNPLDQSGTELLENEVVTTVMAGEVVWCNYGLAEYCSEVLPV